MDRPIKSGDDETALISPVIVLVEKSLGLHRQMHLVLERRIAVGGDQSGVIGDRFAQRLDPGAVALGEIGQHMSMHNILQAGMTDAEPYPLIIVTDMR